MIPGDVSFRDLEILFSPTGGQVGAFSIPSGFALKGRAELSSALRGRVDFHADLSSGAGLIVELDAAFKELVRQKLRARPALKPVLDSVLATFEVRRVALELKATLTELGGSVAVDATVFGKRIAFQAGGSLDPQRLAGLVVDKVKDAAGDALEAAYKAAGRAADEVCGAGQRAFNTACREAAEMAHDAKTSMKHARHTFNHCFNTCVPRYAGRQSQHLLVKADAVVADFHAKMRTRLADLHEDTPEATRALRVRVVAQAWRAMLAELDRGWSRMRGDDEVKNFFARGSSERKGLDKYRGIVDQAWAAHRAARDAVYARLVAGE